MKKPMDEFLKAYIVCALWSSLDNEEPMDKNHSEDDLAPRTLKQMRKDCEQFKAENAKDLEGADMSLAGHDFWLTRESHGAGFWDGDWPKAIGKRLTASAHKFGGFALYVGDDGKIYA
jgi:hypothetical protein